ncbi:deoxyguanosinetriphosphate triphosphohydrolase family protein [Qipengyuania sphaerica]|uniref:deoxyguanosinetriphosphate triphosphohydrolase family protein n=1 Tax=Qipengyuania sphaerica TaxID=2867243 RepID=UPI001C87358C|nr:dNTP triphosphohydrolase [Qipengyuania sphaerica]MBX7539572.1 dNTP triphosphohydrolase [Qipengyuania sphaerica]
MSWTEAQRTERRHNISHSTGDQRTEFQRDRDRLLYSSAFHRLAGITQIVRAGEQDIFHTRQQHTYKVAQIGRRLAEECVDKQPEASARHGVHPEVVEAACLAHDLGHPPFGHAAEKELDRLVQHEGDDDGYEGNAQTVRIITKLAVRYGKDECLGLDLTRATIAACLKYPWFRDLGNPERSGKWSAYRTEVDDFEWAREFANEGMKSAEAELMDWADDIAYSVHDLEDFHRVNIVPWELITERGNETEFVNEVASGWFNAPKDAGRRLRTAVENIRETLIFFPAVARQTYAGTREQRHHIRNFTSTLIGRYVRSAKLSEEREGSAVLINEQSADEVRVLKHLARKYVIGLPALHAQQMGQKRIINGLFDILMNQKDRASDRFLPMRLRYIWDELDGDAQRRAADCIASLTEFEADALYKRLSGVDSGSVLDPIVR